MLVLDKTMKRFRRYTGCFTSHCCAGGCYKLSLRPLERLPIDAPHQNQHEPVDHSGKAGDSYPIVP
jgi:hypothetical protein